MDALPSDVPKTMFARNTEGATVLPPVLMIEAFKLSTLDRFIARIGLSFDSRMGILAASLSESGGVGGEGNAPGISSFWERCFAFR
jgi:hypothetical protein